MVSLKYSKCLIPRAVSAGSGGFTFIGQRMTLGSPNHLSSEHWGLFPETKTTGACAWSLSPSTTRLNEVGFLSPCSYALTNKC